MQNPVPEIPAMQVLCIGAMPVIKQLIDNTHLIECIDQRSPIKKEECHLSVSIRMATLIQTSSDLTTAFNYYNPLLKISCTVFVIISPSDLPFEGLILAKARS
ncbi:hypothetical protein GCM10011391_13570 [Pullulanibacillus camelliae]|uniref:Uncharacterized protein n=1 Tax=Pullulanibacillus camelliae TaxID=1707096 RepID=A0A8J2VLF7_9BACL|nr:hypothetical protein GCM10011391_13570 [Pullulanibacillus camelliae]